MTTLLIANNCTVESGSFGGDQLCALRTAYLFAENTPGVDSVVMSMSPGNTLDFVWHKFIERYDVRVVWDDWNPGDWGSRFSAWDRWRTERKVEGVPFDHYKELYLRIHGSHRQTLICGSERGAAARNIYQYWYMGQEGCPDELPPSADWFDDSLCYHPPLSAERDVYVAPHCKTQGNAVFTFDFWGQVVRRLLEDGVSVTVGYDGWFHPDLDGHPLFKRHWGTHSEWFDEVCRHRLVACGNTGTGWVAAACGVQMVTVEPHNSVMRDHRYRECGLRNIVEVVDGHKLDELGNDMSAAAAYVAGRIVGQVRRRVVMTTGCYDVLHAGHVRHLERARAMGTRLIVALNSDASVRSLKGPARPINPEGQRRAVLEALRCVDEVRLFDGPDALPLIEALRPDVLACGYGYTPETVVGRDLVEGWGGRVAITCAGDAADEPSTTKVVQRVLSSGDVAEVCRLGARYSVNPYDKLHLMARELTSALQKVPSGDVADLGSCRGGSALVLRRLAPERRLHLFDTWAGTPYDDPMCHHKRGEWAVSRADCEAVVLPSATTHYHEGELFFTTADSNLVNSEFCFVYVDMDAGQSTGDAIDYFWPRMVKGGLMVFDDYGWEPCAGVKKTVDDWLSRTDAVEYARRVVQSLYTCVVEKR